MADFMSRMMEEADDVEVVKVESSPDREDPKLSSSCAYRILYRTVQLSLSSMFCCRERRYYNASVQEGLLSQGDTLNDNNNNIKMISALRSQQTKPA